MSKTNEQDTAQHELQAKLLAAERLLAVGEAKAHLIPFTKMTMPDQNYPDDPSKSRYDDQYFHRALAAALEEVVAGKLLRLIITFPPRHGKSELTSRRLPAWILGRDPYTHIIQGTYNQPFAESFGKQVRGIITSKMYRQIFPNTILAKGGAGAGELVTTEGGQIAFVGRGGSSTGKGGDFLIIDDPIKDRQEADSPTIRNEVWNWYQDTISSRLMSDTGAIIIIQTRWHEDDLVGRITDPENPHYNEEEARTWKIINIPAIAEEDDILGREVGAALWPQRFGIEFLEAFRRRNPRGFSALYQQRPTPEDGDLFTKEMIVPYKRGDLPANLRVYAASDHAVSIKQENDFTVMLIVGVDEQNRIWLLDCWRGKERTDMIVERMLSMMKQWKPVIWWAEGDHITKSIGPFLYKRMREEKVYINISELPSSGQDKVRKAQPMIGRMGMGMVRFPVDAPWLEQARSEMLKFPRSTHDDFVDALANIGRGMERQFGASSDTPANDDTPEVGTIAWVKADAAFRNQNNARVKALGGM